MCSEAQREGSKWLQRPDPRMSTRRAEAATQARFMKAMQNIAVDAHSKRTQDRMTSHVNAW